MRVERGPYGSVGVISLNQRDILVSYQLQVLKGKALENIADTSLRNVGSITEICFDVTDLLPLKDLSSLNWTKLEKKMALVDFLRAFSRIENHYLDREKFLIDEKYIFIDPQAQRFIWCYLPLERVPVKDAAVPLSLLLENLLYSSSLRGILTQAQHTRFITSVQNKEDENLHELFDEIQTEKPSVVIAKKRKTTGGLSPVFFVLFAYCFFTYTESRFGMHLLPFGSEYILIGGSGYFLFIYLLSHRKTERENMHPDKLHADFPVDLLFPKEEKPENLYYWPPMFLLPFSGEQKIVNHEKGVILADDFLIGCDHVLCDYFIDHPSVSYRHAKICRQATRYYLVDQHSESGTWVKNQRLTPEIPQEIVSGDILRLGEVPLLFSDGKIG